MNSLIIISLVIAVVSASRWNGWNDRSYDWNRDNGWNGWQLNRWTDSWNYRSDNEWDNGWNNGWNKRWDNWRRSGWGYGDVEHDLRQRDEDRAHDRRGPGQSAGLGAGLSAGRDYKSGKLGLGSNNGWGVIRVKGVILEGGGARAGVGSGQDSGRWGKG